MPLLSEPLVSAIDNRLMNVKIGKMEVFLCDSNPTIQSVVGGTLASGCNCVLLNISCGGVTAWSDCLLIDKHTYVDIVSWSAVYLQLRGLTIAQCLQVVQAKKERWGQDKTRLAETALNALIQSWNNESEAKQAEQSDRERSYLFHHSQSYYSLCLY
ncbi:hypothetical protein ACFPYJ_01770 [Paenibacillus solisilvae]|uniref:Uncharacterized protein n=1 Tax=Paenibacillus solisilvae TaxID=2486751 RepID=A0ABW0VPQ1_9BACL